VPLNGRLTFRNWPLGRKLGAILLVACALPLSAAAYLQIRAGQSALREQAAKLLEARADEVAGRIDGFHREYQRVIARFLQINRLH